MNNLNMICEKQYMKKLMVLRHGVFASHVLVILQWVKNRVSVVTRKQKMPLQGVQCQLTLRWLPCTFLFSEYFTDVHSCSPCQDNTIPFPLPDGETDAQKLMLLLIAKTRKPGISYQCQAKGQRGTRSDKIYWRTCSQVECLQKGDTELNIREERNPG